MGHDKGEKSRGQIEKVDGSPNTGAQVAVGSDSLEVGGDHHDVPGCQGKGQVH